MADTEPGGNKILAHLQEYIARYVMLASIVLVPLAGALGEAALKLGGADTKLGQALAFAASAVGTAAAIATYLLNLGKWQIAQEHVAIAELESGAAHRAMGSGVRPDVPPGE